MKYLIILSLLLISFYSVNSFGQDREIDKNKIADYFQNEQYSDAIKYLE